MTYTSLENKYIKDIKKLNTKKHRNLTKEFLVEGEHLVLEAYKNGVLKTLILETGTELKLDVNTIYVTNQVLKYISELETPQKILGICTQKENSVIGDKVIMLDNVQDPGNLGTIIRSAKAFGIDTIILSNNTVDVYNSKVIRASQGMIFNTNIMYKNLLEEINKLKENDYQIIGTKVNGGILLKALEKKKKFAIIMGNEGSGVSEDILSLCDSHVYIEMQDNCESLNVAVATSIILYEMGR